MQLLCIVHLRICREWQTVSCIPRFEFKRQRLFYWQRDNRWILMRSVAAIRSTLGCPLTGAATHASCSLAAQDTDTRSSRYDYLGSKQRRLLLARLDAWMVGWMDGWVQGPSARFSALGQPQMTQNRRQGRGFTHAHSHSGRNLLTR